MRTLSSMIFAGALLLGACSSTRTTDVATTDDFDTTVTAETTITAPEPAVTGVAYVDSDGRVRITGEPLISDSTGTIATVTEGSVSPTSGTIVAQSNIIAEPMNDDDLVLTETTSMTSSAQEQTTTTTPRTRMRKD